jgi:hypothetical protein
MSSLAMATLIASGQLYPSTTACGLCADVDPRSEKAYEILEIVEPHMTKCNMCGDEAVRVGVFDDNNGSEFRALCERHKQFGKWNGYDAAFGWD